MTAMRGDVQYVVGVACGVFTVEEEETSKLHKVFGLDHAGSQLWERPKVKEKFKSETSFRKHWSRGQHTIHWKCPVELYHWFDQPLALPHYPLRSDKMVLSKMHGSYQALRPEDGITLLANTFPEQHPIIRWLIERDFDPNFLNPLDSKRGPIKSKEERKSIASAAAARKPYKFYLTNREIAVNAHHGELEQLFAQFIKRSGASGIVQNENGIDVRFTLAGRGEVIAELKPATKDETRFALRIAIGQILEYRRFSSPYCPPYDRFGVKTESCRNRVRCLSRDLLRVEIRTGLPYKLDRGIIARVPMHQALSYVIDEQKHSCANDILGAPVRHSVRQDRYKPTQPRVQPQG